MRLYDEREEGKLKKERNVNKNALFYRLLSPGRFFMVNVSNLKFV